MPDFQSAVPFAVQIFADEPPMAMMGLVLGTQQTSAFEHFGFEPVLDLALRHQPHERILVDTPVAFVPLEGFQDVVGRGEKRLMHILRAADRLHEKSEVIGFRETRELRRIVEPDVDHLFHARALQPVEKFGGRGLGEADRR